MRGKTARSRAGQNGRGSESRAGWALICTRTALALGNNTNTIMSSTHILPICEMRRCDHEIQIAPVEGAGLLRDCQLGSPHQIMGCTTTLHSTTSTSWGARAALRRTPPCCDSVDAPSASRRLHHGVRDRVSEAEMTDGQARPGAAAQPLAEMGREINRFLCLGRGCRRHDISGYPAELG